MANAKNIFKEMLFEEKVKKVKKGLKIFYTIDIFLKETPEDQQTNDQVTQTQPETPAPAPVPQAPTSVPQQPVQQPMESYFKNEVRRLTLNEDESIDDDKKGIVEVVDVEIENIQTVEDLVDFLSDKKKKNNEPIFDEFTSELVLTITGSGEQDLSQMLKKDDKVLIDIDYGSDKTDSVGFKVLKRSGVQNISIMMKKDGNILPGKFDVADFNNQLITYRNSIIGDS